MAFPAPTDTSNTPNETITGTPKSIDVPSANDGDLLLMWIWLPAGGNVAVLVKDAAGFDSWTAVIGATGSAGVQMYAKYFDAEGFDLSIEATTHNGSSKQVWFYAECFGTSAHSSTLPEGANNTGSHDPVSLNPAGWDVEDTLWRVIGCETNTYTATPAGYSVVYNPGGAIYLLEKQAATASEDPGVFTGLGDSSVGTVAIRPAGEPPGLAGVGVRVVRSTQRWR